jgi:hypothetical protein
MNMGAALAHDKRQVRLKTWAQARKYRATEFSISRKG